VFGGDCGCCVRGHCEFSCSGGEFLGCKQGVGVGIEGNKRFDGAVGFRIDAMRE